MTMTVGELMILGLIAGLATFCAGVLFGFASVIRRRRASIPAARLQLVGMATVAATPALAMLLGTDRSLPDQVWIALILVSLSMATLFLLLAARLRVGAGPPG
jgi:uncharacterized membrane protein